jgi:alpha-galactosidase
MKIPCSVRVYLFFVSVLIAFGLFACGGDQQNPAVATSAVQAAAISPADPSAAPSSSQITGQSPIMLPPMGWASWNAYGCNINESLVKTAADTVSGGLKRDGTLMKAGYSYINVDDCWFAPARDPQGNLVADPIRFPDGMKALGDYIHARGLKFGIYEVPAAETCAQRNKM